MGKVRKRKIDERNSLHYMVFVAPFTVLCVLTSFMIIQFIGERCGFSPIISLQGTCVGCTKSEMVIVFVIILSVSVFIGLLISYLIIKKVRK